MRSSELVCCLKPIRIATSIIANLVQLLKYRRSWVRVLEIRFIQSEKKTAILHQNKFQKRANFQTWWSTSTMSVTSEKPRMLTIYRSNQSTESDQKAILLNFLPNESNTLYYILLTESSDIRPYQCSMFLHFRLRSLVGRGSDSFLVCSHTDLHIDNSWDSHHIRSRLEDKKKIKIKGWMVDRGNKH